MKLYTDKNEVIDSRSEERKLLDYQIDEITKKTLGQFEKQMYVTNSFQSLINPIVLTDKRGDEIPQDKGQKVEINKMSGLSEWLKDPKT